MLIDRRWLKLPTPGQRAMALYILAMPLIQAVNGLMLPLSLVGALTLKAPVGWVLVMFSPFVPLGLTIVTQMFGLREFSREFQQRARLRHYGSLLLLNFLYQWVLTWSALMAALRLMKGKQNWLKTDHVNLHRRAVSPAPPVRPRPPGTVALPSVEGA